MSDIEYMQRVLDQQKASLQMMHENYNNLLQCVMTNDQRSDPGEVSNMGMLNNYNRQQLQVEPHKGELIEIEEEVIT